MRMIPKSDYDEGLDHLNPETREYVRRLRVERDNADFFEDPHYAALCAQRIKNILNDNSIGD